MVGGDYVVGAEGFTAIIAIGANYFHNTQVFRGDCLTGGAALTWSPRLVVSSVVKRKFCIN